MTEIKKVKRIYFIWDFEKEIDWLNEMSMKGWILEKVGFVTYFFKKGNFDEYSINLEVKNSDPDYLELMKELNIEYIGSISNKSYYRRKKLYGNFDLYSDLDSKIFQLEKVEKLLLILAIANLTSALANIIINRNISTFVGIFNILVFALLIYALGRINSKKDNLKTQRNFHE